MDQNPVLLMHGALDRQPKQGVKRQLLSDLHGLVIMKTEKTVGVRLASHHTFIFYPLLLSIRFNKICSRSDVSFYISNQNSFRSIYTLLSPPAASVKKLLLGAKQDTFSPNSVVVVDRD
jgi:hypothetical protein